MSIKVDSGYLLTSITCPQSVRDTFEEKFTDQCLRGTITIAPEGLNWCLSGEVRCLEAFNQTRRHLAFEGVVRQTRTSAERPPFGKFKIRIRPELVTSGIDPASLPQAAGKHVSPEDFNALMERPEVRLIDVRNHYEIALGTFPGAEDPNTESFAEFRNHVQMVLAGADKSVPLALCCTGGIRCERASQLLLKKGFHNVYQLDGGILAYLSQVPLSAQKFSGECFVFDERERLTRTLAPSVSRVNEAKPKALPTPSP